MKRFLRVSILVFALILVTGCGSKGKTLTCTTKRKTGEEKYYYTYKAVFNKKDELKKFYVTTKVKADRRSDLKDLKEDFDDEAEDELEDIDGITYKSKISDGYLIINATVDMSKIDEDDFEDIFDIEADIDYDDLKDYYEDNDYEDFTCK